MSGPRAYLRSLSPGLPRSVWTLEAGFLVNAYGTGVAASLLFSTLLPLVPEPMRYEVAAGSGERRGGYLDVIRHRPFLGLVFLNFVFISVGQTQLELLPVFAKNEAGVNERQIGLIFLVSTLVLVVCQLPLAKLLEGRSRMRALALMPALWAMAWLVVEAGGAWFEAAAAALVFGLAAAVFGLGECLHGPTQGALVADLAPPLLRGRYLALSSSSWDLGYVAGPAIGGAVLAVAPLALWPLAAAICLAAAAGTLLLERVIPRELRLTPG